MRDATEWGASEAGGRVGARFARNAERIVVLLVVALPLLAWLPTHVLPQDEGQLLVYPERVLAGAIPYRDFSTFYGPGNLWTLAGAFAIFGPSVVLERAIGILYRCGVALLLFVVLGRRHRGAAAGSALILSAAFLLAPVTLAAYAWLGALALILLAVERLDRGRGGVAGVACAAAITYRPDILPCVLALAPLVVSLDGRGRRRLGTSFGLGLLPLAVTVVLATPAAVFENLVVDAVFRTRSGRSLPLSFLGDEGLRLLLLAAASGALLLLSARRADAPERRLRATLGLLGLASLLQVVQRPDGIHLSLGTAVPLALLPFALVGLPVRWRRMRGAAVLVGLLLPFVCSRCSLGGSFALSWRRAILAEAGPSYSVTHRGRVLPVRSPDDELEISSAMRLVEAASAPGDRVFIAPADLSAAFMNETALYFLLPQLVPAGYYLEMNPGSANRAGSRLASDIATAKVVLLSDRFSEETEGRAAPGAGAEEAIRVLRERFVPFATAGRFLVLRNREAGPPDG